MLQALHLQHLVSCRSDFQRDGKNIKAWGSDLDIYSGSQTLHGLKGLSDLGHDDAHRNMLSSYESSDLARPVTYAS
jgi:hypothetical protein